MHGGASCEGSNEEKGPCDMKPCLINGEWLPWGHWDKCSKTCDKGIRTRTRTCNMTSYGDLTTDCIGPSSGSQTCNEFDCGPAASCTELQIRGLEEDAAVMIDPDGDGPNAPIEAHCDMTGEDGVTEIWHNYMNETLVENFQGRHLFFRSLGYDGSVLTADHPQLVKLITASASCKQFISFKCKGATFKDDDMTYTYWVNRDDEQRWYWGGGLTIEPYGCDCDLASSCAAPKVTCNCNIGDDNWREDSGYITNVDDLPVRKFFVGNTGDGRQGLIAVGPLLCWGTKG